MLVQIRTEALRFTTDAQRSTYSGHAAIVVRIRDAEGQGVQKLSQEYLLTGGAKDVDAARSGEILFFREVDLDPGVYTMEVIVFDAAAGQGSARLATLTVPASARTQLGMSSLLLVNRVEEVKERTTDDAPLFVGSMLLYPNLGEPIGSPRPVNCPSTSPCTEASRG